MSTQKQCAVRGMVQPGAMCGKVLVGGKGCGYLGACEHQRESDTPVAQPETRQVFRVPSRHEDPVGHAKFWFGAALWQVLIQQAAEVRLHLHSGLVPGMSSREALIQLRRLENRNLLVRTAERQGGHIIFILRDKVLRDHLMNEAAQRAQQREGQPNAST